MIEVVVNTTVKESKSLGKFKNGRARPITLLVISQSQHESRMIFARARGKRESLSQRNVFLLPALSKNDDALTENLVV